MVSRGGAEQENECEDGASDHAFPFPRMALEARLVSCSNVVGRTTDVVQKLDPERPPCARQLERGPGPVLGCAPLGNAQAIGHAKVPARPHLPEEPHRVQVELTNTGASQRFVELDRSGKGQGTCPQAGHDVELPVSPIGSVRYREREANCLLAPCDPRQGSTDPFVIAVPRVSHQSYEGSPGAERMAAIDSRGVRRAQTHENEVG